MNKFEQHIKTSLENYKVDYNPAHWEDMQNRLNKTAPGKSSPAGKILGIAAAVLATAGLIYFFSTHNSGTTPTEKITAQNLSTNAGSKKENSVQQNERNANDTKSSTNHQPAVANSSDPEKTTVQNIVAENKTSIPEKTESVIPNTTAPENNTPNTLLEIQNPSSQASSPSLAASFHTSQNLICSGTEVQFVADVTVPCTYRWEFGDRTSSGEKSPSHVYKTSGNYTVKLKITSTKDKTSAEQVNTITVNPTPIVDMNYSVSDDNVSEIKFMVKGTNAAYWIWNFDDKQSSSEQNPVHIYTRKGNYNVSVMGTGSAGCTFSDKMNVTIDNVFPFAPNSFSLNQDGVNDTWFIPEKEGFTYDVKIFNSSGTMMKEHVNQNNPWDGAGAKIGDRFLWKAAIKDKNGKTNNYQDYIIIVK